MRIDYDYVNLSETSEKKMGISWALCGIAVEKETLYLLTSKLFAKLENSYLYHLSHYSSGNITLSHRIAN